MGESIEIASGNGILLSRGGVEIALDPKRKREGAVVSHGHMDHLVPGALMTPETLDILRVRTGSHEAEALGIGEERCWNGFDVRFHSAGHVLGSVMMEMEGILYTGDFSPEGSFFSPLPNPPQGVDVLITEATYGERDFVFPPKTRVLEDIMSWMDAVSAEGAAVVGAYEFGKAQEIMNIGNKLGVDVFVPEAIANISKVYNKYGADLHFSILDENTPPGPGSLVVVPNSWLRHPKGKEKPGYDMVRDIRKTGGRSAFVSGWCAVYKYFRSMLIDAQFPLSDHADHHHLLSFVRAVEPKEVLIVHSGKKSGPAFAADVEKELGIKARIL
ncbi:MAG: hypothetical protein KAT70_09010 [Thermoplasmata archaeon]|nr:hypothetical protein [Thermoplasmata archaeon]